MTPYPTASAQHFRCPSCRLGVMGDAQLASRWLRCGELGRKLVHMTDLDLRRCAVHTFHELASHFQRLPGARPLLVAVDGPGGSGKSTFARRLSAALGGAPIVPTDDFASADTPLEPQSTDRVQRRRAGALVSRHWRDSGWPGRQRVVMSGLRRMV